MTMERFARRTNLSLKYTERQRCEVVVKVSVEGSVNNVWISQGS